MIRLLAKIFNVKRSVNPAPSQEESDHFAPTYDPLDPIEKVRNWKREVKDPITRTAADFMAVERVAVGDAKFDGQAMDDTGAEDYSSVKFQTRSGMPEVLSDWYMSQSFIGYQACAIVAQHWLVDKACSMAGEDAIRQGWEIKPMNEKEEISKDDLDKLRSCDISFKLKANLAELDRWKNIFGIRVAIFHVESDDEKYYEKPFNLDGVTEGSYKGISQIDPYWMMPTMTAESTSDPANIHFYDPEFWVIGGKKYHRSHLIIARGPAPADVLKPTYIFGGVPMTQRIYERVYAAERTANEAPLLALNKRTTALHVDVEKAIGNQTKFEEKLAFWIKYRDNHAVKVLGKEEVMEQFDTSLSDFDAVIMNQYQLVSAIAKVPSTKLLGTSPKGFNATGESEEKSYHEELESIQEHTMSPMAERHYAILGRSLGITAEVKVVFNPVDSVTAKEQAELNKQKSDTDKTNVDIGAISPDEVRDRLRNDPHSGYNNLTDDDAEETPGMSPENLAALQKSGAEQEQAQAAMPGAPVTPGVAPSLPAPSAVSSAPSEEDEGVTPVVASRANATVESSMALLAKRLSDIEAFMTKEGQDLPNSASIGVARTSNPSVNATVNPTVRGIGSVVGEGFKQPKMKVSGLMLAIENPRGSVRKGMDISGTVWESVMPHHYGFIKGVNGADGDDLDCFVGPNLKSDQVFIVNQNDPDSGDFDEHKVMLGFDDEASAKEAYQSSYSHDWNGFGSIVPMSMGDFKSQLTSNDWSVPFGNSGSAQDDKAGFKESDHPRAKNGQFGSGGSGGSTAAPAKASAQSAGAKKNPGSKKDALPMLAHYLTENTGKTPTPAEFHDAAIAAGFDIIPAQSVKYLKMYLKGQKDAPKDATPEVKKEPKVAELKKDHKETSEEYAKKLGFSSASALAEGKANKAGYANEGKYNSINYYKAPNGDKVSYKADADTWAVISGGKVKEQGSGVQSLDSYLVSNKAAAAPAAKPNTMANAAVSVEHHATSTAKKYGDVMPAEEFKFAKSGIANETALPAKVKESITAYKGSSYHEINKAMRFNESFDPATVSPTTMAHILNLQRAFSQVAPSTKDVTVGRKITSDGLKAMAKDAGVASLKDLKAGMILREPGIVSTSHDPHVWSGDVKFEIKLPKGSKAIDISETIKLNQGEQEVLLGPDSKLKIHEVKENHKAHGKEYKYHIVCELVQ